MNWILCAILILFVVGVRPCLKAENEDYISRNAIQPVKGLFILLFDQTVPRLWGMLTGKHSGAASR